METPAPPLADACPPDATLVLEINCVNDDGRALVASKRPAIRLGVFTDVKYEGRPCGYVDSVQYTSTGYALKCILTDQKVIHVMHSKLIDVERDAVQRMNQDGPNAVCVIDYISLRDVKKEEQKV